MARKGSVFGPLDLNFFKLIRMWGENPTLIAEHLTHTVWSRPIDFREGLVGVQGDPSQISFVETRRECGKESGSCKDSRI